MLLHVSLAAATLCFIVVGDFSGEMKQEGETKEIQKEADEYESFYVSLIKTQHIWKYPK